ncbi:MAG: glycosyltransferase family 2 protein [Bryobacteraceae bacterium]|nr:glycosyltransferase family 2 protein [Bryobacteraceae bacterium]
MEPVSVVVPHWNRRDLLKALLKLLPLQTYPIGEILIVDNGSGDGSVELARSLGAAVLPLDRNYGFSYAVNRGVEAARCGYVAVVNNDVAPEPDWLAQLVAALEASGENAWFAAGRLVRRAEGEVLDGTFDLLSRGGAAWRAGNGRRNGPQWEAPRRAAMVPLTAAVFRRRLFALVGGLEERFESYLEDVEFGLRCTLAGYGGLYVPGAVAVHEGSATLGAWHSETTRRMARNQLWLIALHRPGEWLARYPRQILVAHLLWGLVALRHGQLGAWLQGKWEGLCTFRTMRREGGEGSLAAVLEEQEQLIFELQRATGFDAYWRWYFRLAGRPTR